MLTFVTTTERPKDTNMANIIDRPDRGQIIIETSAGTLHLFPSEVDEITDQLVAMAARQYSAGEGSEGVRAAAAYIGYEIGHESWLLQALDAWADTPEQRQATIERRGL